MRVRLAAFAGALLAAPVVLPPVVPGQPPMCVFGCDPSQPPPAQTTPAPPTPGPAPAALGPADSALPACRPRRGVRHSAPPAPHAPRRWALGEHLVLRGKSSRDMCAWAERAANSGITYAREDFNWYLVEPRPGTFDWRRSDNVVATAARYGITVLPILDDPPTWAGGPLLPTNAAAYARFAARAVARYGPDGTFWRRHPSLPQRPATWFELLNEPYYAIPAGHTPDPAAYARLVAATTPVARAANPRARFLIEAETTYFLAGQSGQYDWIGGMYAAVPDFGRYFDGLAAHPYTTRSPLDWGPTQGDHRYQGRRIEDMRAALLAHGDGAKHIWITEVGWSTCTQNEDCVSEAAQARYLRALFHLRRTRWRSYVDAIVGYEFRDGRSSDPRMAAWGLLHANGAPKPGWYAVRAARPR